MLPLVIVAVVVVVGTTYPVVVVIVIVMVMMVHSPMMCHCYESPREERVSHAFTHLISNIKSYNGVKI